MAKILILDDSPAILAKTREILEDAGYDVTTQSTPAGLPAVLDREQPDLILLDVGIPLLEGDKTLRALRSRGWGEHTTVLLFSAKPADELERLAATCGADGYFCKGDGDGALVEAVKAHLTK